MSQRAPAGLTYVSDDAPGITRRRSGKGFSYRKARPRSCATRKRWTRIRRARHPAGMDRCLDQRRTRTATSKPPAATRAGASSTAITPRFREAPRRREVRSPDGVREGAAGAARPHRRATCASKACRARKCIATIVHLSTPRSSASAMTNTRTSQQKLWPHHAQGSARPGERRQAALRLHRQVRQELAATVKNRRVAKIVKAAQDLPGQRLFQYEDEDGRAATRHLDRCERLSRR